MGFVASFSERFTELLNGESYSSAAEKLSVSKATVGAWATGARSPKRPVLLTIARVYNVDPLWLLGYDTPKYKEAPGESSEGLSEEKIWLIEAVKAMSDEEVRAVRAIVDQVLALRGK